MSGTSHESIDEQAAQLALELGQRLGSILLMAAGKQAYVNDLTERLQASRSPAAHEAIRYELMRQEDKLASRRHAADCLLLGKPSLILTEVDDPRISYAGALASIDVQDCSLVLTQPDDETLQIPFASPLPIPEGLDQTYFDHRLNYDFVVQSIPPEFAWTIR